MPFYKIFRRSGINMNLEESEVEMSEVDAKHRAIHDEVVCELVEK